MDAEAGGGRPRPRFGRQQPLFDARLVPVGGDQRSVGELVAAVDRGARDLLFDVGGSDAAGLLRAWPGLVYAAFELWRTFPGRPADVAGQAGLDRPVARVTALSEGMASRLATTRWPGPGPLDPRLGEWTQLLQRATRLVEKYGADVPTVTADAHQGLRASRATLLHALYLCGHAVTVSLHERGREAQADNIAQRILAPAFSSRGSPTLVGGTRSWSTSLASCERTLSQHFRQGGPTAFVPGARHDKDPLRLERAAATWDIQVHRTLAMHPDPGNIHLVCRGQAVLTAVVAAVADAAADGRSHSVPVQVSARRSCQAGGVGQDDPAAAWNAVASRWRDLCGPHEILDPALVSVAGELRAAIAETRAAQGQDLPGPMPAAALDSARRTGAEVVDAAPELAVVVVRLAASKDLTGPARALSRRLQDDARRSRGSAMTDHHKTWVRPQDIAAERHIPLPTPLAGRLRGAAATTLRVTRLAAMGALELTPTRSPGPVSASPDATLERHRWPSGAPARSGPGR